MSDGAEHTKSDGYEVWAGPGWDEEGSDLVYGLRQRIETLSAGISKMQTHRDAWRRYAYTGESRPRDFLDGDKVDRGETEIERLRVKLEACERDRERLEQRNIDADRIREAFENAETVNESLRARLAALREAVLEATTDLMPWPALQHARELAEADE